MLRISVVVISVHIPRTQACTAIEGWCGGGGGGGGRENIGGSTEAHSGRKTAAGC